MLDFYFSKRQQFDARLAEIVTSMFSFSNTYLDLTSFIQYSLCVSSVSMYQYEPPILAQYVTQPRTL